MKSVMIIKKLPHAQSKRARMAVDFSDTKSVWKTVDFP